MKFSPDSVNVFVWTWFKVVTKKEVITRTEYIERERNGEVMERPTSVMGERLPHGPGM